jgi:3-methyladenine DNA glycosylase AlkD
MDDRGQRSGAAALLGKIRSGLRARAVPTRALAMQAYMKSRMPFYGVAAPQVHALVRELAPAMRVDRAGTWRATIRRLWDEAEFREERYVVIGLCRSRPARPHQRPSTLPLYGTMITTGAWWDSVDEIATHLVGPILRSHPKPTAERMRRWSRSDDLWLRRASIIAQVGSRRATDQDLLAECIAPSLPSREFFLRKAIGWALRSEAANDPRWVAAYVTEHAHELSPLSRREALRHIDPSGAPRRS